MYFIVLLVQVVLETVEKVYNKTLTFINTTRVTITPEDRLFLLHSRLLYVYDVIILYAAAFNAAIGDLNAELGNVTEDENDDFCGALVTPLKPNTANILTEKMNEILNNSAFCGYSVSIFILLHVHVHIVKTFIIEGYPHYKRVFSL